MTEIAGIFLQPQTFCSLTSALQSLRAVVRFFHCQELWAARRLLHLPGTPVQEDPQPTRTQTCSLARLSENYPYSRAEQERAATRNQGLLPPLLCRAPRVRHPQVGPQRCLILHILTSVLTLRPAITELDFFKALTFRWLCKN